MRGKKNLLVLGALACGLLITSCGETPTVDEPVYHKLTVETDSGVESVSIKDGDTVVSDLTRIEEGTELTAVVDLKEDFEISAVTLDGTAVSATGGSYVFDMPSKDATFKVTTKAVTVTPEAATITVTNDDTKGTYSLTVGDEAVSEGKVNVGDKVKLTVTPNSGFAVSTITLDGTAVTLTDGAYEFTVSKTAHTIAIEYVETTVNVSLSVYNEPSTGFYTGYQLLSGEKDVTAGGEVELGSELKVVLKAEDQYNNFTEDEYRSTRDKVYLHIGDKVYHGDDECAELSEDFQTLTFTVPAPEADTELVVAYNSNRAKKDSTTGISVKFAENENLDVFGYSETDKYESYRFTAVLKRTPGYTVTKVVLNYEDGTSAELTETYMLPSFTNDISMNWGIDGSYIKDNMTISFEGEVKDVFKINYVNGDSVKADVAFESNKIPGEMVNVYNIKSADPTKSISEIKFTGVECTATPSYMGDSWSYYFVMPENEVTIEFVFEDLLELSFTPNDNLESVVFRSSSSIYNSSNIITHAKAGAMVYAFVTPKDGFLLGNATDNAGNTYQPRHDYGDSSYYQVTVPEDGLVLTISCDVGYSVTVDSASTSQVSTNLSSGDLAVPGSTFNFSYRPVSSLYTIKEVYLTNADGERVDVAITPTSNSGTTTYCSFTMPAYDVVIHYTVEQAATFKTTVNVTVPEGTTLSEVMPNFSLRNSESGVNLYSYSEGLTVDLVEGTSTSLSIQVATGYEASASYTYTKDGSDAKETIQTSYVSNGSISFNSFMVPANIKSIDITITKADPVKVTITHDESVTDEEFNKLEFEYTVNNLAAENLDSVYKYDTIVVEVTTEAGSGYVYLVEVTDNEGNPLETRGENQYYVTGDFTITVTKTQAYSFSVVYSPDLYISANLSLSNGETLYSDELIFGNGLTGFVRVSYSSVSVDYVVTVGGEEVDTGSILYDPANYVAVGQTNSFEITGDVVVTFTAHVDEAQ